MQLTQFVKIAFFSCLFVTNLIHSQTAAILPRKVMLGASVEQTEQGISVKQVLGATAEKCKLQTGDILLKVNEKPLADIPQLIDLINKQLVGSPAVLVVKRKKKTLTLKGTFEGKPFETSNFSEVVYDQAPYKKGNLRVIINKPKNEAKMPALLFIPGYTCSSIDNLSDNHPYKRIIDVFANAGFVTLRIEKAV